MIDAYITYIRDIRRYSPRTQDIYRDVLEDFARFSEGEVVASLTPSMLRRYEADCINRGMKPRTVHQHMSVLSGFCRFLMLKGVLKSNSRPEREAPQDGKAAAGILSGKVDGRVFRGHGPLGGRGRTGDSPQLRPGAQRQGGRGNFTGTGCAG
jgi:Site-specific recombinase XerD